MHPFIFGVSLLIAPYFSSAEYVLSKRTIASSNGALDSVFFSEFFGATDPSSTYGSCLDRYLEHAAPDNLGIHFPTSYQTPDVPVLSNGKNSTMRLSDWDRYRVALHNTSAQLNRKSAFHDFASVFYVPDLGPHVADFGSKMVPFVSRRYSVEGSTGGVIYILIVATPGNGHTLELQAPTCTGCKVEQFKAFEATECAAAHKLSNSLNYYDEFWKLATSLPGFSTTLKNSTLQTPLLVQIRAPVVNIETANKYLKTFLPMESYKCSTSGGCRMSEMTATTNGFATFHRYITNYTVAIRFVENTAAWTGDGAMHTARSWADWTAWTTLLHTEFVGEGWGYDRVLDYHFKLNDVRSIDTETQQGVHLDYYAKLHAADGLRFSAFNTSNSCPSSGGGGFPGGGFMMYSEGIEGTSGVELWGDVDGSYFGKSQLYNWNGCSPSMGCTYGKPEPMCFQRSQSKTSGKSQVSALVVSDWPQNLATMNLGCERGVIKSINFVSYGNPQGNCQNGFSTGTCDVKSALQVVKRLCEKKKTCVIPTTPQLYGATANNSLCPAADWPISLAVSASCGPK